MHTRTLFVAVLVVLAGLLTACGGSSLDDASEAAERAASEAAASDPENVDQVGDVDPIGADSATSANGDVAGIATMVVDGTTYEFSGPECLGQPGEGNDSEYEFRLQGAGKVDGQDFFGFVQRRIVDLNSDGEDDILHSIVIEVGITQGGAQAPAGQPSLLMQVVQEEGDLSITYEPGRLGGKGALMDRNNVLASEFDEIPFTFVATCI